MFSWNKDQNLKGMGIQQLIQWLIFSWLMYTLYNTTQLYQWCLLENVAFLAKDIQYSQFRIDLLLRWDCKHGIESLWFCFVKIAEMLMFARGKYLVNILIKVCLLLRLTTHKYWYCADQIQNITGNIISQTDGIFIKRHLFSSDSFCDCTELKC